MYPGPILLLETRRNLSMNVFLVHWNEQELAEHASALEREGHRVRGHFSTEWFEKWGEYLPDAVVVSLDRLPSHGRQVAEWFWEAKYRRSIPVLFVGGEPAKIEAIQSKFPAAVFSSWADLPAHFADSTYTES